MFRDSFRSRRCIVPADGFYEWQSTASWRQPYFVQLGDHAAFGFAGLWNQSSNQTGELLHTFTILTTRANTLLIGLHRRMPVILDEKNRKAWLTTGMDVVPPNRFNNPYPSLRMTMTPVSKVVNNSRNESIDCLQAITVKEGLRLFAL